MAGLALMLVAQEISGSFARAGVLAGSYIIGLALAAPAIGRFVDRHGPRVPLVACATAHPALLCALVACLRFTSSMPAALCCAFLAGATFPPITACMRTFLRQRLGGADALLSAAFSMESLLIESIFILGPALVALFVAFASAQAAVLFCAVCTVGGTFWFLQSAAIRHWTVESRKTHGVLGPLSDPGFLPLLVIITLYASAFGMVEMGVTGHATTIGHPAVAGLLLSLMSVGSAAGALAYGGRSWSAPLSFQFALALLMLGAATIALGFIDHPWVFALASIAAGTAMAPSLIIQSMLVARLVRPEHSTEAFTWSATALLAGISGGIAAAGSILEHHPAPAVFTLAGATATCAAAVAMASRRIRKAVVS